MFAAGPSATKLLCEWGAEVIKVEQMTGDMSRGDAGQFGYLNMNKKSIALNMKDPTLEILNKLIDQADIL
jgi:crotonobetainyl-CoA:carnitine CoA-transferase CaiB-like acyl-CoA transferase